MADEDDNPMSSLTDDERELIVARMGRMDAEEECRHAKQRLAIHPRRMMAPVGDTALFMVDAAEVVAAAVERRGKDHVVLVWLRNRAEPLSRRFDDEDDASDALDELMVYVDVVGTGMLEATIENSAEREERAAKAEEEARLKVQAAKAAGMH